MEKQLTATDMEVLASSFRTIKEVKCGIYEDIFAKFGSSQTPEDAEKEAKQEIQRLLGIVL